MSRSPVESAAEVPGPYGAAWTALNTLLRQGYSWSGRERGCAWLNLGPSGFAGISAVAGLDQDDDTRATARVDWDGDGDLDLFLTGRTGPRVRFLRNEAPAGAWVTLEPRGTRSNRDGIGARVELTVLAPDGERRVLLRGLRAGEGYLAQSSGRLTVGLGDARTRLEGVRVTWPGGVAEDFTGVEPGRSWRLVEGQGRAEALALPRAASVLAPAPAEPPPVTRAARVPLVRPVPLPRLDVRTPEGEAIPLFGVRPGGGGTGTGRIVHLALFSVSCAPCARELSDLAARADELTAAGIAPLALSVDPFEERAASAAFLAARGWPFPWAVAEPAALEVLDALQGILLDGERRMPLPSSFLVDAGGALRVLYVGPTTPEVLLRDRELCEAGDGAQFDAASPFPGRWMFPGLPADADFFEGRFRGRGLAEPAREFARGRITVVQSSPADLLQDFGRRAAVRGELDQAEDFFRRAVDADPTHFGALFDWAVVLHRQERVEEALELYRKALVLEPESSDTRFNIALAQLALGDRDGAARQLRWLEAHDVEGTEELARLLAEDDGK